MTPDLNSLKVRAILLLAGLGLASVVAVTVPSVVIVRGAFAGMDRDAYTAEAKGVADALTSSVRDLRATAEQLVGAAADSARGRWQPLEVDAMVTSEVDQLAWFRGDGALVAATHVLRDGDTAFLLAGLSPDLSGVLEDLAAAQLQDGILHTPGGPLAVGVAALPDGGRILALRRLTSARLLSLVTPGWSAPELVDRDASFLSPRDVRSFETLRPGDVQYDILSDQAARATTVVRGVLPAHDTALRLSGGRPAFERGGHILVWLVIAVTLAAVSIGTAAYFIVNRWVVDRVQRLRNQVEGITRTRELDRRADLPGGDELTLLASAINLLLASREKMTNELEGEIRERIRTQDRLSKLNRELENTLQFRQDLSNMLVHDIRSPLTVIDFFLQIQARKQGERTDTSLQLAQRSVNRLNMMINDLLIMAKFEAGKVVLNRTEFDLRQLITRNIDEVRFLAQKRGVGIEDELPAQAVLVDLDANLLWRVVENLLGNAVKYSPENRPVIVRLERVERSNFFEDAPEEIRLSVIDEGPGIPNELHEAIFEKWNIGKLDRSKSQIGLGLSFCRMIVEAQGGRIWVENNTPHGSIFRVVLPGARTATKADVPTAAI